MTESHESPVSPPRHDDIAAAFKNVFGIALPETPASPYTEAEERQMEQAADRAYVEGEDL